MIPGQHRCVVARRSGGTLVIAAVVALAGEFPLGAIMALGVVAAMLPASWGVVRRGRPRPLDPARLPPDLPA